ncbi:MAG: formylglycine-generating enzyme family protein [Polyangiaceae bacterium]|nr:formylglycine-generating enzyme family protein [Polyangiaceae bacterium]
MTSSIPARRRAGVGAALAGVALAALAAYVVSTRGRSRPAPAPPASSAHTAPLADAPSCATTGVGTDRRCGAGGDADCCEQRGVPAGTFKRSFDGDRCGDPAHPATVSAFALDRFEVTVGRFRAFVAAGKGTRASAPAAGAGAHPKIPGSGWDPAWDAKLPESRAVLEARLQCNPVTATWTSQPTEGDRFPINCLTFYEAFAFCAWDGGRLPTEAEWNYAAAGGDEQRVYAWSSPPAATGIDQRYAAFGQPHAQPVGARARGAARWGQEDMSGNVWEWTIDTADPKHFLPTQGASLCPSSGYLSPCVDCAQSAPTGARITRGSGYGLPAQAMLVSLRRAAPEDARFHVFGVRCARDAATPSAHRPAAIHPPACVPRCAGRPCGPDGCGGVCGSCPGGGACDGAGTCPPPPYPGGPYGCDKGATIPDFDLAAFMTPESNWTTMEQLKLSDLYNPSGDAPSTDGAAPRPRALLLHAATAWSDEAKAAAGALLGSVFKESAARGGAVLSLLVEGERRGQQADSYNIVMWTRRAAVTYPAAMDLGTTVAPCVRDLPATLVVDTRTMRVVEHLAGSPVARNDAIFQAYGALLAAPRRP